MVVTIGIPTSTKKQGLFFTFIAYIKSKREKKFLWQNNVVFHRVALSSP
jgi:hypothetical protein